MANKDGTITINNFQNGIAKSSYLGFEEIRCLNITDKPGIAYPNYAMAKESSTVVTALIIDGKFDGSGDFWGISSTKLYKRTSSGTWSSITLATGGSSGTHYGIAIFGESNTNSSGYLFLFAGLYIDVLSLADETTWSKGWANLGGSAVKRPALAGQDNVLYFGMGENLGSVSVTAGDDFDPADSDSYTVKNNSDPALDLPKNSRINALEELGSKLLVCAGETGKNNLANVYPWDRTSPSFEIPITFNEDGDSAGWQVKTFGLRTYIHVGSFGNWYVTDGTNTRLFATIPKTLNPMGDGIILYDQAIDIVDGRIYFGLGSDSTQKPLGIYSLDINTASMKIENVISTGEAGDNASLAIGVLKGLGAKVYMASWQDDNTTTYGVDKLSTTPYTGDLAYLISQYFVVGDALRKMTFSKVMAELAKKMVASDSLKVYYRQAQKDTWINIVTWDTDGDQSLWNDFGKSEVKAIQFKIVVNNTAELLLFKAY